MQVTTVDKFLEAYILRRRPLFAGWACEAVPKTFRELSIGDIYIALNKRGIAMGWAYNEHYQIKTAAIYQKDDDNIFHVIGHSFPSHPIRLTAIDTLFCVRLLIP